MERDLREVFGNQLTLNTTPLLYSWAEIFFWWNLWSEFFNPRSNMIAYFWPFSKFLLICDFYFWRISPFLLNKILFQKMLEIIFESITVAQDNFRSVVFSYSTFWSTGQCPRRHNLKWKSAVARVKASFLRRSWSGFQPASWSRCCVLE